MESQPGSHSDLRESLKIQRNQREIYSTWAEYTIMEGFMDLYTIYSSHPIAPGHRTLTGNGFIYEYNSLFVWDINLESICIVWSDGDFAGIGCPLRALWGGKLHLSCNPSCLEKWLLANHFFECLICASFLCWYLFNSTTMWNISGILFLWI